MNLLIIDDEKYVIESIRQNVDWEKTGIDRVYSATAVRQAEHIMESVPIEIVLCDIQIRISDHSSTSSISFLSRSSSLSKTEDSPHVSSFLYTTSVLTPSLGSSSVHRISAARVRSCIFFSVTIRRSISLVLRTFPRAQLPKRYTFFS